MSLGKRVGGYLARCSGGVETCLTRYVPEAPNIKLCLETRREVSAPQMMGKNVIVLLVPSHIFFEIVKKIEVVTLK